MSLLRPGLHVVRRDDRHLQVGLDPPWLLVVPDEPDVQRLLDDLLAGRAPEPSTPAARRVLTDLGGAGMLRPLQPPPSAGVVVTGPADQVADVARLLGDRVTARLDEAAVAIVLAAGEPTRASVDEHVRDGCPHLVLSAGAWGYRVGPFVAPGRTACLRCVDAHLGESDPRRAVALEQLAGRPAAPDDPALWALASAWAARDVLRFLAGECPSTWSATVDLPLEADPVVRPWRRHPYCGCAWAHPLAG